MLEDTYCIIDGDLYYFDKSGFMYQNKWIKSGDDWYYVSSSGSAITGWKQIGSVWYYFDKDCKMVTGEYKIDGRTSIFNSSGAWLKYKD